MNHGRQLVLSVVVYRVFSLVAQLRVFLGVDWRGRARAHNLRRVLLVDRVDGQRLDTACTHVVGRRDHRYVAAVGVGWRQVVHLERGDLGQVANYFLGLSAVLHLG